MGTPILTEIEENMASLIEEMTKGGGYNYDWGSVNEPDRAKQTFPSAEIYVTEEENLDDEGGAWGSAYYNECTIRITVHARLDEEAQTPLWEINKELNKALDDLKKLFGSNYSVSGKCDTVLYRGMERETEAIGDAFLPKRMHTDWLVRYTQYRTEPSTTVG